MVFQESYMGVSRRMVGCFKEILSGVQKEFEISSKGVLKVFKEVSRHFQGCVKEVSRVFQESFEGVSMEF